MELPDFFNNAIVIAKKFQDRKISQYVYDEACNDYWKYLDDRKAITVFNKKEILYARVAISLLSTTRYLDEASLGVDWFLQLLGYLKIDTKLPMEILNEHFEFNKK